MDIMPGFKPVAASDSVLASYLRKHGALNRHIQGEDNTVTWLSPANGVVAIAYYVNSAHSEYYVFIPAGENI